MLFVKLFKKWLLCGGVINAGWWAAGLGAFGKCRNAITRRDGQNSTGSLALFAGGMMPSRGIRFPTQTQSMGSIGHNCDSRMCDMRPQVRSGQCDVTLINVSPKDGEDFRDQIYNSRGLQAWSGEDSKHHVSVGQ